MKILVDSLYINNSGGKVLLNYLVESLRKSNLDVFYLFDDRCSTDYKFIPYNKKIFLKASLINRYKFYKENKNNISKVFCFGNIPPPLVLRVPTYTYFHNVSLLSQPKNYSIKEKFIKKMKLSFIKFFNFSENIFIVQSNTVSTQLKKAFPKNQILILPFYDEQNFLTKEFNEKVLNSFVYVSNGNTHKNHIKLLDAWQLLSEKGLFPKLSLTVTENFVNLNNRINEMQNSGILVVNYGFCDPSKLYNEAQYLIYPSLTESFGLGLVEAIPYQCEIIASDLPYVYEICEPLNTFNPENAGDIAQTVENVLNNYSIGNQRTKAKVENKIKVLIDLLKNNETNYTIL